MLEILQSYQEIIRSWSKHLTIYEYVVLLEIADHTWGWGKGSDTISTKKLLYGNNMYAGLSGRMGRTAMFAALASLEEKGVITRNVKPRVSTRYKIEKNWTPDMLDLKERPKEGSVTRTRRSVTRTTKVRHTDTIEGNLEKVTLKKVTPAASATPRSARKPEVLVRKAPAAQTRSLSARPQSAKTVVEEVEAVWRMACHDTFSSMLVTPWSGKAKGMVKGKANNWLHRAEIEFPDFTDWAVRNWTAILRRQFKWMTRSKPPETPDVFFFITHIDGFADCWSEDKLKGWRNSKDRTEAERLRAQGLSDEEAAAEIGKRRATEELREEMEKSEQESRARLHRAAIREERAERLERQLDNPRPRRRRAPERTKYEEPDVDWANLPTLDPNWEPPD